MSLRSSALPALAWVLALVLVSGLLVGCGSSADPEVGQSDSTVRSEAATGRGEAITTASGSSMSPAPSSSTASSSTGSSSPASSSPASSSATDPDVPVVVTGAAALVDGGLAPLLGRRVGLIANQASTVAGQRLIDVVVDHPEVEVVALFAPEHGVDGTGEAGSEFGDGVDTTTGVVIHSLYGATRAPAPEVLAQLDVLVFDLQDVGARFYTYTSTLGLAMQAATAAGVPIVVLDRPNPLGGDRPDGPLRDAAAQSFIGLYPIPVLHGLTTGELAMAIVGEGWLDGLDGLDLEVIELQGWDRAQRWPDTGLTWSAPSPGLPTAELSLLYPATVLLEATTLSVGRGTGRPFGQFGAPWLDAEALTAELQAIGLAGVGFEAVSFRPGEGEKPVPGVRLTVTDPATIRPLAVGVHVVERLLDQAGDRSIIDRPDHFDLLAGTSILRQQLLAGDDPDAIVDSWADDLAQWDETRAPYLLYGSVGS